MQEGRKTGWKRSYFDRKGILTSVLKSTVGGEKR